MFEFERLFKKFNQIWIIVFIGFIIFSSVVYWDRPLASYLLAMDIKLKFPLFYWFSCLGDALIYLFVLPAVALFYRYRKRNKAFELRAWFLWLCVLFPTMIAGVFKTFIGRARPELWIKQHTFGLFGWHTESMFQSLPSGHATAVTGMMIGLLIIAPRFKYIWILAAICLIMTRVIFVNHFLSDVIISTYLVFFELLLLFKLMRHMALKKDLPKDVQGLCQIVS